MQRRMAFLVIFMLAGLVSAQEFPEPEKPTEEHKWLNKFVGKWETESKANFGPDQPPLECSGTIESRSLGGFWVVSEMKSQMFGVEFNGLQTIGYDPASKKYVGSWVDSMTSYLWRYEGSVNDAGTTLTLQATGPDMTMPGKTAEYRDVYEFKSNDEIAISSQMQGPDGEWITFMTGTGKRKK